MVMNRNPIPIVLPCHRIVGANGSLTGYAGGLDVKERLLRLEGVILYRGGRLPPGGGRVAPQAEALAPDVLDHERRARVGELAADAADVRVEHPRVGLVADAPHVAVQLGAGEDPAGRRGEPRDDVELAAPTARRRRRRR